MMVPRPMLWPMPDDGGFRGHAADKDTGHRHDRTEVITVGNAKFSDSS